MNDKSEFENKEEPEVEETEVLDYETITTSTTADLFKRFQGLSVTDRLNMQTNYCLAKALGVDGPEDEGLKLEFLKESGRNDRTLVKGDVNPSDQESDPVFGNG